VPNPSIMAPASVLLAPDLSASLKLVWLAGRETDKQTATLAQRSGLSPRTIVKVLAELEASHWLAADPRLNPETTLVPMYADLLAARRISPQSKLFYGCLQLTPGFDRSPATFRFAELSALTGCSLPTVRNCIRQLEAAGWLRTTQETERRPVAFSLHNPIIDHAEAEVAAVRRRLRGAWRGEALMREYLSVLVDCQEFHDNAAPDFLINPQTDALLQLDRFYPSHSVAFEFNGKQHYEKTERFSAESALQQRVRDLMKIGLCANSGIKVVTVHAEDLGLEGMQHKVGSLLPLRELAGHEQLIAYLEARSKRYRSSAKSDGWLV
jgi:DNA-binding Lrp family transcriptional regulator